MNGGLMNTEEAAAYLSQKPSWLRDHPEVPRVKLGHTVRYRLKDLDAYIEAHVVGMSSGRSTRSKRGR